MADQKLTALSAVVTPVDADIIYTVTDVAGTPTSKKGTWTVVKAFLKTYFDTLYPAGSGTCSNTNTGDQTVTKYAAATGEAITSTSLVDIGGMTIALTSGTWVFDVLISGSAATGTAGAQFGVNYSGTTTSINALQVGQLATTTWAATARITAFNTASTVVMTTSAAQCSVRIFGKVIVTGSGNLTAKGMKVTSQTLTLDGSSWMSAFKVA